MKLVSVAEMRRLEAEADAAGNTYADMMERAGAGVARAVAAALGDACPEPVVVLVGPGNNGGDGLVAARHLALSGYQVRVHLARPRGEGDANWQAVRELGIPVAIGEGDEVMSALSRWLGAARAVVDSLLGTGARPPVEGAVAAVLEALRRRLGEERLPSLVWPGEPRTAPERPLVVAVDVPSALDADSGDVDELTPRADITVTMGLPKVGLTRFPGAARVGRLAVVDIGLPQAPVAPGEPRLMTGGWVASLLPERPLEGHKGTFGSTLVVGGSVNYVGAPLLAAAAAARAGSGLVGLAGIGQVVAATDAITPESVRLVLPSDTGVVSPEAAMLLRRHLGQYSALLLGPGLGREKPAALFVAALLAGAEGEQRGGIGFLERRRPAGPEEAALPPLVVDADGLNVLADRPALLERLPAGTVLTPHPGEMARLLGSSVDEVQRDRPRTAAAAAERWRAVVVLKGAMTVVAGPDGELAVAPFANPGLASGGTGDVLAGALAGLLAQGMAPFAAACAAVYLHGMAGEMARDRLGDSGIVAGDLLELLPEAQSLLRQGWR